MSTVSNPIKVGKAITLEKTVHPDCGEVVTLKVAAPTEEGSYFDVNEDGSITIRMSHQTAESLVKAIDMLRIDVLSKYEDSRYEEPFPF